MKDANGSVINDGDKFIKDETIFAISKKKTIKYKVEHLQENIENDAGLQHEKRILSLKSSS